MQIKYRITKVVNDSDQYDYDITEQDMVILESALMEFYGLSKHQKQSKISSVLGKIHLLNNYNKFITM